MNVSLICTHIHAWHIEMLIIKDVNVTGFASRFDKNTIVSHVRKGKSVLEENCGHKYCSDLH